VSDYNKAADIAEKQLKFFSPTMCYAKWAQVSMHLTTGMTHSCYHPPLHTIDISRLEKNPSALHNTEQKKLERKQMLNGEKPAGCSYCWKIEDVGGRSDRIYRSGEYWAQNAKQDIIQALDTGDVDPRYVEVNFNQACNFKCSYCSPHLSTEWESEINTHGPYAMLDNQAHNDTKYLTMPIKVKQEDNPYVTAFWKWWPDLYKKLEVFRITGGEPLMDVNTFKVLDYIYDNPNQWLEISVTSNFCPPKQELMDKFINKLQKLEEIQIWKEDRFNPGSGNNWYVNMAVKNVAIFISLDSVGEQAEYIRNGLDFGVMDNNVHEVLAKTNNTTLTFINTFNALSVPKFKEFLEYILNLRKLCSRKNQGIKYIPIVDPYNTHPDYAIYPRQRVWFDVPLLRNPSWQSIKILGEEFDSYLVEAIEFMKANANVDDFAGFYDFEIEKVERNLAFLRDRNGSVESDRKNLVKFFSQHDERRNTDFCKTFPELANMYKEYNEHI
jgi:organic radical activating enzyme